MAQDDVSRRLKTLESRLTQIAKENQKLLAYLNSGFGIDANRFYSKDEFLLVTGISPSTYKRWLAQGLPIAVTGNSSGIHGADYIAWRKGRRD